jgi:hypothetical protein
MAMKDTPPGGDAGGGADGSSDGNKRRQAMRAAARRPVVPLRRSGDAIRHAPIEAAAIGQPGAGSATGAATSPFAFVSYSRSDLEIVRAMVHDLRSEGASIKWDQDFHAGDDFEREIRKAIAAAHAVIVLWSSSSAASPYVRGEAGLALKQSKLITMHVEDFDVCEVPFAFSTLNAIPVADRECLRRSLVERGIALGR